MWPFKRKPVKHEVVTEEWVKVFPVYYGLHGYRKELVKITFVNGMTKETSFYGCSRYDSLMIYIDDKLVEELKNRGYRLQSTTKETK
jgi:hypothetical protein